MQSCLWVLILKAIMVKHTYCQSTYILWYTNVVIKMIFKFVIVYVLKMIYIPEIPLKKVTVMAKEYNKL